MMMLTCILEHRVHKEAVLEQMREENGRQTFSSCSYSLFHLRHRVMCVLHQSSSSPSPLSLRLPWGLCLFASLQQGTYRVVFLTVPSNFQNQNEK